MENIKKLAPMGLVLSFFVFLIAQYWFLEIGSFTPNSKPTAIDHRWRFYWGISSVFLLTALTWSYVTSVAIIRKHPSRYARHFIYSASAIALVMAVVQPEVGGAGGGSLILAITDNTLLPINSVLNIQNTFAVLCVAMMIFSTSSILLLDDSKELDVAEITHEIHKSLNSNALLLVFGIVEVFCLYSWSASFGSGLYAATVANTIILTAGFFFSFILALVYVPLFFARKRWLTKTIKEKNFQKKEDLDHWLATNSIEEGAGSGALGIMALMLPLATGVLFNILSEFVKSNA